MGKLLLSEVKCLVDDVALPVGEAQPGTGPSILSISCHCGDSPGRWPDILGCGDEAPRPCYSVCLRGP